MLSLWLIACHMIGDYILQTNVMAARKLTDPWIRASHVSFYTLVFGVPVVIYKIPYDKGIYFLLAVWITHFITDSRRWASADPWPPKPILVDQAIHLFTLAILCTWIFGR